MGDHAVLFEGEVTQVANQEAGCDPKQVTLTALDLSYRLRKRPFSATNHVGALSAIVRNVVTRDAATGVAVGQIEPDPDPQFTEEAPLRQSTQNDWDFLVELARRYNCRTFVEYNAGASKFYFIPLARLLAGDPLGTLAASGMAGRILRFGYDRTGSRAAPRQRSATVDPATGTVASTPVPPPPTEPSHLPEPLASDRGGEALDSALAVAGEATELPRRRRLRRPSSDPSRRPKRCRTDQRMVSRPRRLRRLCPCAPGSVEVTGISGWRGPLNARKVKRLRANYGTRSRPSTVRTTLDDTVADTVTWATPHREAASAGTASTAGRSPAMRTPESRGACR